MALDPEIPRRLGAVRRRIIATPFIVVIWGPGTDLNTLESRKRRQLKDDLEAVVGEGRVFFSEDPELSSEREAGGFAAEYIQVRAADAVVIIPESPGALTEAALYQAELLGKTIVFTKRRDKAGFARAAYDLLTVHEIEPEEWRLCNRVRRLAREFVESLRVYKFRAQGRIRFDWELS